MLYITCDPDFQRMKYYCCEDDTCFEYFGTSAGCREYYDERDGTTCKVVVAECPC